MKTKRIITSSISKIEYRCPHCEHITSYETDSLPTKNECHFCLKELEFEDVNI